MSDYETAFIGLGSNEGDRMFNIGEALRKIHEIPGVELVAVSPLYETSPIEVTGGTFINAVAIINTVKDPPRLMDSLLKTESEMGRTRSGLGPASRNIDIDLLLYGERTIEEKDLSLPHPRMTVRRFVMEPLADLVPDLLIPGTDRTAARTAEVLREQYPEQEVAKVGKIEEFYSHNVTEKVRKQP